MKSSLQSIMQKLSGFYQMIKELDELPMRNFQGEFYEGSADSRLAPRKNKVKLEDLRPQKPGESET